MGFNEATNLDASTGRLHGTPTATGTGQMYLTVTDSYGNSVGHNTTTDYATMTVNKAVETGTLIPANCSLEQLDAYTAKKAGWVECTVTVDEADDGTYQYYWYANGNGTGLGNVHDAESDAVITNMWTTGTGTVNIGGSSYNKAGTVYYSVKVKDTQGNEFDSSQLNWSIR